MVGGIAPGHAGWVLTAHCVRMGRGAVVHSQGKAQPGVAHCRFRADATSRRGMAILKPIVNACKEDRQQ